MMISLTADFPISKCSKSNLEVLNWIYGYFPIAETFDIIGYSFVIYRMILLISVVASVGV